MLSDEEQKRLARDVRIIANETRVPVYFFFIVLAGVLGLFGLFTLDAVLHYIANTFTRFFQ